jgi:hypothetical protein
MSVGRPSKFNTVEELQEEIDKYFNEHKPDFIKDDTGKLIFNKQGQPIIQLNPPTITGLALALGFVSRQSMYDYEKHEEYSYTIKNARLKCENWVEEQSFSGNVPPAVGIFALKNYGWRDTQEIEHSGKITTEYSILGVDANKDTSENT